MNTVRLGALGLLLVWMVSVVGCAAPAKPALVDAGAADALGYGYHWTTDLQTPSGQRISDARIHDDLVVLIEQPSNIVWTLDLRDGNIVWRKFVGEEYQPLFGSIRRNGLIHVNSPIRLYSLNADNGDVMARADLETTVSTAPSRFENFAIFGTANGRALAHNLNTGFARWAHQLNGQVRVAPVIINDRVFVADTTGSYALLDAYTGQLIWRRYTYGPITATPAADDNTIYVASQDRSLYALNLFGQGRDRWIHHSERVLNQSPLAIDRAVLLPLGADGLVALDKRDGSELWRINRPGLEPVHLRNDGRVLLKTSRSLLLIDPENGDIVHESPTQPLSHVLVAPDEDLILVSAAGRLLRLEQLP